MLERETASCARRMRYCARHQCILRWGARPPVEVMVGFINAHRDAHSIEPICAVLPIAPSTHAMIICRSRPIRHGCQIVPASMRRCARSAAGPRRERADLRCPEGLTVASTPRDAQWPADENHGYSRYYPGKLRRTTIPDRPAPCPLDKVNRGNPPIVMGRISRIFSAR